MSKKRKITITYKGETATLSYMARKYGVPLRTLQDREYRGWTPTECINGREGRKGTRQPTIKLKYKGTEGTIKQWSIKTGVSLNTLASRHARGWPVNQIIEGK